VNKGILAIILTLKTKLTKKKVQMPKWFNTLVHLNQPLDYNKHKGCIMEHDKNIINEIFEKYEQDRLAGKSVNWNSLDNELKKELNISYKSIKPIINEYYNQNSYREICYGYAKAFQCVEFHPLIRNYESQNK